MIKKNNNSNKKQSTRGLPVWNLADLYTSITSKKIYLDLTYVQKASIAFEKKYEGKITKLNSKQLFKAISDLEKIDEKMDKIYLLHIYLLQKMLTMKKIKFSFNRCKKR